MRHLLLAFAFLAGGMVSGSLGAATHHWQSYAQVRYTSSDDRGDYLSLRRLKLFGQGPVSGDWTYFLQFLYKDGNRSLTDDRIVMQEANVSNPMEFGRLTLGQFKPPFGMERFTSDYLLPLIDRSQPTDRLIPNGNLGISFARARGAQIERKIGNAARCAMGVFDGNGANEPFEGNGPLVVGRLLYESAAKRSSRFHCEVAVSWRKDHSIDFLGQLPGAPPSYAHFSGKDIRQDIAVAYDTGNNAFRAEYIAAQYNSDRYGVPSIDARGYYLQWARAISESWSAAVRYETMDPNISVTNAQDVSWLTVGATYCIDSYRHRIQANYVFKSESVSEFDNDAFLVQYQRFF